MARLPMVLLTSALLMGGCRGAGDPTPEPSSTSLSAGESAPSQAEHDPTDTPGATSYSRTLEQQLDLIPPDADGYLVVRDLRPLIAQARRVEQVMAGPLARAIPALARLGGGSGELRLEQLGRARDLLALVLAGLESAGVELDQGLVFVQGQGEPLILFAAADLGQLTALAGLAGADLNLEQSCVALDSQPPWFACSLGGAPAIAQYRPAMQGAALAKRLRARFGGGSLDSINVALSLAEVDGSIDAVLRTDPGLWELSLPIPLPDGQNLLAVGPAPALHALVPGTSFMWARVDPTLLGGAEPGLGGGITPYLTGELWFGAVDEPNGFVARAGIREVDEVATLVQTLATMLPDQPIDPAELGGLTLTLDRASIELDGQPRPSIGLSMTGDPVAAWTETLGVAPRLRVWAHGEYLSAAVGEVQAIPSTLARVRPPAGPPVGGLAASAVAGLPPTLSRALLDGEVGLVLHLVLDHWQAPPSEGELASLLVGVSAEQRPDLSGITALFQALAPWSSVDVWLRREGDEWIATVTLVPFGAAATEPGELAAAGEVLDGVLAGNDGRAGYTELLARYPQSAQAHAYRARAGLAPQHHATAGMVEVGLLGALVLPSFGQYADQAKTSEARRETQVLLAAALELRERTGSCTSVLGETGPTPALSVECHLADGGRCHPVTAAPRAAGEYALTAWTEQPLWAVLDYRPDRLGSGGHRYHYEFEAAMVDGGCRVRVRARGDLDGDGQFSTFEREATIGADGSQTIAALRVELETE